MAYTQATSPQIVHQQYRDIHPSGSSSVQRRHTSKPRFVADLSQCLFDFVIQLLPTAEEMAVKEDVRKLLERLIRTIEPDSRLLSFGSTANGFSLRNSDMDLCCLIDSEERLAATDLVTMLGDLLERETKFHVKPLPHARIPIVKLSLDPSPGLPLGIACDIGFENRLALENTRLLMCYAMIDPTRVRTMVLFLKVWSKRRKINSPYKGTLSSYGYVLLVIYFLVHVKNPPVLPNLQQMPPLRPISKEDTHLAGYNTWFFDDIDLLRQRWHSENTETVAELLIDFFRYYSRDFLYNTGVASIRAGLLKKDTKGWQNDLSGGRFNDARERNRLCIEDPFELDYNVARCVTKDGLYTIRGEFMRAARILAARPERAIIALAELCEERKDEDLITAPPPRTLTLPPQTPYTVGSQSMRPKGAQVVTERLSPATQFFEAESRQGIPIQVTLRPPPEHMAPKRGKWTSPPPPEAPPADHSMFESQLGFGLELATSSTEARERETSYNSSESNSEVFTDEDRSDAAESDEITSVKSFTNGSSVAGPSTRRPSWHSHDTVTRIPVAHLSSPVTSQLNFLSPNRGRIPRLSGKSDFSSPPAAFRTPPEQIPSTSKTEFARRSISGSSRPLQSWVTSNTPLAVATPLPPSPQVSHDPEYSDPKTVFYQTTTTKSPTVLYPNAGSQSPFLSQQSQQPYHNNDVPSDIFPANLPPSLSSIHSRNTFGDAIPDQSSASPETPTPSSHSSHASPKPAITAPTPSPHSPPHRGFQDPTRPCLPHIPHMSINGHHITSDPIDGSTSPEPSACVSNGSSPTPSSNGYSTSISRSPSPHSPSPPPTTMPMKPKGDTLGFPPSFSSLKIEEPSAVHLPQSSSPSIVIGFENRQGNE